MSVFVKFEQTDNMVASPSRCALPLLPGSKGLSSSSPPEAKAAASRGDMVGQGR